MIVKLTNQLLKLVEKTETHKAKIKVLIDKLELLLDVTEGHILKAKEALKKAKELLK